MSVVFSLENVQGFKTVCVYFFQVEVLVISFLMFFFVKNHYRRKHEIHFLKKYGTCSHFTHEEIIFITKFYVCSLNVRKFCTHQYLRLNGVMEFYLGVYGNRLRPRPGTARPAPVRPTPARPQIGHIFARLITFLFLHRMS